MPDIRDFNNRLGEAIISLRNGVNDIPQDQNIVRLQMRLGGLQRACELIGEHLRHHPNEELPEAKWVEICQFIDHGL